MSSAVTLPAETGLFHLPLDFPLASGERLEAGQLAFEAFGPANGPVVLVLGGISSGRHVASIEDRPGGGTTSSAPEARSICSATA